MYKDAGINIAVLDKIIDTQFINVIEQENNDIHFARIDAEVADVLKADGEVNEITAVADLFKKGVNDKLKVTFDRLKDTTVPAILNVSEETRRMNDMMKMYKMDGLPTEENLIVNLSSPLVDKMNGLLESEPEKAETLARQIYMLASIAQRPLTAEELVKYLEDNYKILEML
jgi:molecular chaperone HtpG